MTTMTNAKPRFGVEQPSGRVQDYNSQKMHAPTGLLTDADGGVWDLKQVHDLVLAGQTVEGARTSAGAATASASLATAQAALAASETKVAELTAQIASSQQQESKVDDVRTELQHALDGLDATSNPTTTGTPAAGGTS